MGPIGFSTGALAKSDFRFALRCMDRADISAVELSALREDEVDSLIDEIPKLNLSRYQYVSFHAPSKLRATSESEMVAKLSRIRDHVRGFIVHPDIITDANAWSELGDLVVLENMDQRKRVARTAAEMEPFFNALPAARFCFDIGHARQVDPTMSVAVELLVRFADKLAEIHISEVNAECRHVAMSFAAVRAYQRVSSLIPFGTPTIIESMVPVELMEKELSAAYRSYSAVVNHEQFAF